MSLYGEAVKGLMPDGFAEQASDPRRVVVTMHGARAEAALRIPSGSAGLKRATLRLVSGAWLIDGLGEIRPR